MNKIDNRRKSIIASLIIMSSLCGCAKEKHIDNIKEETSFSKDLTYNEEVIESNEVNIKNEFKSFDGYLLSDEIIYDNYMNEIMCIDMYQKVKVLDYNNGYYYINYNNTYGYIRYDAIEALPSNYIEVDISDQKTLVYNDNTLVLDADVVTGNPSVGSIPGTNLGYQEILEKTYNRSLVGDTWDVYVNYFFPFNTSGEGFHDASWRNDFGSDIYTYNGSHGCVNMKYDDVKIMDDYIEVGTKVLVHK